MLSLKRIDGKCLFCNEKHESTIIWFDHFCDRCYNMIFDSVPHAIFVRIENTCPISRKYRRIEME